MASTYTVNTGIELIANGEQSGTWGDTTNLNLEIIDRLTNGVGSITLSGTTHTLTTLDGLLSDGQFKVLVFGGTPSGTNTVTISPSDQDKQYFIVNSSGQSIILTQGSGTSVTVADGATDIVFADGGGAGANVASLSADLSGVLLSGNNLSDVVDAGTSRTNLGVAIGTDVLAYDANLQAFVTAITLPTADGSSGQALTTNGSGSLSFSDVLTASGTQTLTNKTIAFADNTLTGVASLTGTETLTNKTFSSPQFTGSIFNNGSYRGNLVAVAALDIDLSAGNYFTKSISANSTFTFSNAPASRAAAFTLRVSVTGDVAITWPASVEFPGDEAPTLTAGKTHLFMFVTDDGGTTFRGAFLADYEA